MGSRALDIHYTLDPSGYTVSMGMSDGSMSVKQGPLKRKDLVRKIFEAIQDYGCQSVSILIGDSEDPHVIDFRTVAEIREGQLDPCDFTIGELLSPTQYQMQSTHSRWVLVRTLPKGYVECPVNGCWAYLISDENVGHVHCDRCGVILPLHLEYWMKQPHIDLVELADLYPSDRYFINRSWNEEAPWLSWDSLQEIIGEQHGR